MQDNPNTDNVTESPWVDTQDWTIAFEPYDEFPDAAHTLSVNLALVRTHISSEPRKIKEAIAELDRASDVLFFHSRYHDVSYLLFRRMTEGKLSFEEQKILKSLGIKS